ncbi:TolC family protein [Candidatus Omnitrophota bacterium]
MRKIILFILLLFINIWLSAYAQDENSVYLSLEEACEIALMNNFDIQIARFDAQFKGTDLDSARSIYDTFISASAGLDKDKKKTSSSLLGTQAESRSYNFGISQKLPTGTTLGLDFANQRSWTNSTFTEINPAFDSSGKLSLKQELGKNFFGLKDRSDIKITKIDIENAQYTSLDKIEQALSIAQQTYWEVAQRLVQVEIRKGMLLKAEELFGINEDKFKKGIIEKPQLIASEANLRQKEIDLILAENELEFSMNKLKLLLNLDNPDTAVLPQETLGLFIEPQDLAQSLNSAFQNRRDFLKARNEAESQKIKLVMQKNNLWPEINLEASVTRNGLNNHFTRAAREISSEDNPEYFLGLEIKFPLQNRQARSQFNKAKIEKAKALLNLKMTERRILVEINDGVRNCQIAAQRAQKQENVVSLQEEKLDAELKNYEYGRSDTDTIIRYQDDLLLSRILYAQALLDYKKALIELALKENVLLDRHWKDSL